METVNQEGKHAIPPVSLEARLLYDRLSTMTEGEEIEYSELNDIVGRNVQTIAYGALKTARNMCMREHSFVIETVIGKGIRRLKNDEIAGSAQTNIARIRKQCRNGAKKLACTVIASLPDDKKLEYYATQSNIGAIAVFSKPSAIKQLEEPVKIHNNILPVGKVLELFKG